MGLELTGKFYDENWYHHNREIVKSIIRKLPHYSKQETNDEFWLKDSKFLNSWNYDVRIFTPEKALIVEVSSFSKAFTEDIKSLYNEIRQITNFDLINDDDEIYDWNN
jgi:hypothetical protein